MNVYNLYKDGQLVREKITAAEIGKILNRSKESVSTYLHGRCKPPDDYNIEFIANLRKTRPQKKAEKPNK